MANDNIDIIRVQVLESAIVAALRTGQLGFTTDGNRLSYKRLSDSVMKYWSDDSKQCLLASNQTLTGNKTYTGNTTFNNGVSVNATLAAQKMLSMTARVDLGLGSADLATARAAQDSMLDNLRVEVEPTVSGVNDYYSFSALSDGQLLWVFNSTGCVPAKIDANPTGGVGTRVYSVAAGEQSIFIYDSDLLVPAFEATATT